MQGRSVRAGHIDDDASFQSCAPSLFLRIPRAQAKLSAIRKWPALLENIDAALPMKVAAGDVVAALAGRHEHREQCNETLMPHQKSPMLAAVRR